MKKVKILCGGYGYTPPGTGRIKTVYFGDTVTVSDEEAARLAALNAAEVVGDSPSAAAAAVYGGDNPVAGGNMPDGGDVSKTRETAAPDPVPLEKMTVRQLAALAEERGVDVSGCRLKADYISAIVSPRAALGDISGGGDADSRDGDAVPVGTPPDLSVEEPVQ